MLLHVAAAPVRIAKESAPTKLVGAPTVAASTPHPTRGAPPKRGRGVKVQDYS
ncbi:hypothetical protein DPMN_043573 [Dreissena polymorpha]|uniref:Uncharacterized protein n=1 Tax=Dreissena polymorpha TaxID=45954 RepID=A0A9D4D1A5_DREPO|nr:hypothetical protein DPMN_043573 [Dreissena polymorpha]